MEAQNVSDIIEKYLKEIINKNEHVEIRRAEIAQQFNVVPSQINYVIKTRFTIQNGYLVQSKRGGGGYIRIAKVNLVGDDQILKMVMTAIGDSVSEHDAFAVIQSLYADELLTRREANLILAALDKETLQLNDRKLENNLRARILVGVLNRLRFED
ncbi:CtsR family transcriptional regulator [Periweissella beninensis]|uniref:CtsR family transcriptional regulator n=1 Tax=Periweissella beninensis TaxID=504936 RepID=UPI0021A89BF9|nr:CtsR family transcriptional regulator [Periweissella beninensis]MCT4395977.1 CtsR family transcriptional regulator [Periweissella beninensis]